MILQPRHSKINNKLGFVITEIHGNKRAHTHTNFRIHNINIGSKLSCLNILIGSILSYPTDIIMLYY